MSAIRGSSKYARFARPFRPGRFAWPLAVLGLCWAAAGAQDAPPAGARPPQPQPAAQPGSELSVTQARLADRFKRLEEVIGRLAELSAGTDPRRAELLRQAIAQSREQDIHIRFESVVKLLEEERLSAAVTNQTELQKELDGLLNLLLKADRDTQLVTQRERVRGYLKELGRLLRLQQGVQGRTEGGDEIPRLQTEQQRVADDTKKLSGTIDENEREDTASDAPAEPQDVKPSQADGPEATPPPGQPSPAQPSPGQPAPGRPTPQQPTPGQPTPGQPTPGQPTPGQPAPGQPAPEQGASGESPQEPPGDERPQQPIDRALERLRAAQQDMEQAREQLEQAERENAVDRQRAAIQALEVARAELERVLRQLREEEMERVLTQLAARFRRMLELQTAVYDGTVALDKILPAERGHNQEIEAARLSRQEAGLVREADKALLLLREEGSSVAFPETVELMRDDMRAVTALLSAGEAGKNTQELETDILAALEETIASFESALKEMDRNRGRAAQSGGEPSERPLVDVLAELKMIRSLQMRVNRRTQRYGEMIGGDEATTPDLLEALRELAERQARVHQAAADLSLGRNAERGGQ